MKATIFSAERPDFDPIIKEISHYVLHEDLSDRAEALQTARYCLMDSIACALMALRYPACVKLLGPTVPHATLPDIGAKVPGTKYQLEPVQAAFNFGAMIRWLDFNDTWLAKEWGHPSDNLGGILMLSDYLSRERLNQKQKPIVLLDVLKMMIKAHEIQGILALDNSFNAVGLDHVMLVRIASTAVACQLLQLSEEKTLNAVSHAWLDGSSLRTYRHAPNTGSRKSWAAGDATSRAVRLALIAQTGEMGYPSAVSAPVWGFQDVLFNGETVSLQQKLSSYVMEHVLFKISYPAEFHAQTAVEAAVQLHSIVKDKLASVEKITIETQESAHRIINKTGALDNPADRDHCIQYMVAVGLIKGNLQASDYENDVATMPEIDQLREKMQVTENASYSKDYLNPDKRSIANAVQVFFKDGSQTEKIEVHYPVGHKKRREEGIPLLLNKFASAVSESELSKKQQDKLKAICLEKDLSQIPVHELTDCLWLG